MAEILLAREESEGAGARYLVVKRILPEFERDASFVDMFLDEARVMMRLKHPNVCHVYKFGQQDGTHFIAMEYVEGASLGKLIRRARKAGGVPMAIACKVIALIAEALDHAHSATDDEGHPLSIVHRDVTPDNLMISYDGSVKLLDFGIAKADARAHKTQAGVVKGKFAYMAPEQCRGKELDHRVDVFALGVCLYEALTGRPLYRRETEFETMEAIVRGPVPTLGERVKSPPPELEHIIAKCLAKKAGDRFASAGELQEALDTFLASRGDIVTARRIKELMDKLFAEDQRRGPVVDTTPFGSSFHFDSGLAGAFETSQAPALGDLPLPDLEPTETPPYQGDTPAIAPPPRTSAPPVDATPGVKPLWTAVAPPAPAPGSKPPPRPVQSYRPAPQAPKSSSGWIFGVLTVLLLGAVGFGGFVLFGGFDEEESQERGPARVRRGTLTMSSVPPGATLFVDD
ncbi:MAG: serine/threonine protein kinase, partial [Sandaracinaceae bacterium]|nr:serine/threonine protein kinase [Sandaracinaceae bacterium]